MSEPIPFSKRLVEVTGEVNSSLCVGLDPDVERLPEPFDRTAGSIWEFCRAIIDSTQHIAAAYKPNIAFFEVLGSAGFNVLEKVCEHVRDTGRLLIVDGKRGDIGNTAKKYAEAQFGHLQADAVTVSPYMGMSALTPFLEYEGRCVFVLVATSNPDADAIQEQTSTADPLYQRVARMSLEAATNAPGEMGFVVGGTKPDRLASLREAYPTTSFLVPGIGAQGGSSKAVLDANAGGPILVNSSRSILYASNGKDFAEAAMKEAETLAAKLSD